MHEPNWSNLWAVVLGVALAGAGVVAPGCEHCQVGEVWCEYGDVWECTTGDEDELIRHEPKPAILTPCGQEGCFESGTHPAACVSPIRECEKPNRHFCLENSRVFCTAEGIAVEEVGCGAGFCLVDTSGEAVCAGRPEPCQELSTACLDEGALLSCTNGVWMEIERCYGPEVCRDGGQGFAACTEHKTLCPEDGARKCDGYDIIVCEQGVWLTEEACHADGREKICEVLEGQPACVPDT
jgi:hypothetical protein